MMKWSWRIGRVMGIDLHLHATFLVLIGYAAWSGYRHRGLWLDGVWGVIFIGAFFGIVILHELGHCLTARYFGIGTRDITLLPVGGLARLERMPEKPGQELLITIAGPAVNGVIALLLYALLRTPQPTGWVADIRLVGGDLLTNLFRANALMGLFNLIPAFPMDGGRVLRALFGLRMNFARATETAATVGQAMAWGAGAIALSAQNWWLLIIAVFVFFGAEAEADFVRTKSALAASRVADVMIRNFRALTVTDPLGEAVKCSLAGFQQDFPVVAEGRVVGVLTRRRLLAGLSQVGQNAAVGDFMLKDFRLALAGESTGEAFQRLQDCDCHAMPVLQDQQLVGILTVDNLGEYAVLQTALQRQSPSRS